MTACLMSTLHMQAVEDLCLHKMAAGLYERLQKVCTAAMCRAYLAVRV